MKATDMPCTMPKPALVVAMIALLVAPGCTSKVHPTAPPLGPAMTPDSVQAIFDTHCISCHSQAGGLVSDLDLAADISYAQLVGIVSYASSPMLRVKPSDPDSSTLVLRVEGNALGARMPYGASPLPPEDLAKIRNWVAQGALPVYGSGALLAGARETR